VAVVVVVVVAGFVAHVMVHIGGKVVAAHVVVADPQQAKDELTQHQRTADDGADEKDGIHGRTLQRILGHGQADSSPVRWMTHDEPPVGGASSRIRLGHRGER